MSDDFMLDKLSGRELALYPTLTSPPASAALVRRQGEARAGVRGERRPAWSFKEELDLAAMRKSAAARARREAKAG